MITNTQATTLATLNASDALEALKKAKADGYAFRGTGYNGIGFSDGEPITSFEGVGFPTWEDNKEGDKGTYVFISFNHKKISLKSFIKDKFLLNTKGELTEWKATDNFAKFIVEHPFIPEMTDDELLTTINTYITEGSRLVANHAKFSAVFGVSVQGGYAHKVGKYNIVG